LSFSCQQHPRRSNFVNGLPFTQLLAFWSMRLTSTLLLSISCCVAAQAQSLQLLSTFTPPVAQGPVDAVATPNRLYVADFSNPALRIYDTSQPTKLVQLGSLSLIRPRRVVVSGTKAYVSSVAVGTISQGNIYAVDISNSAAPSVIRTATVLPGVAKMAVTPTLLCAAISDARTPQVYVYDSNLNLLSTITAYADGIELNDKYLYLLSNSYLDTYDLSVPSTPVRVSTVRVGAYTSTSGLTNLLAFANNYLYINGHAGIFSVSNPALPALASANSLTFNKTSGATAYQLSASANSVVTVVDLRVPTAPKVAATAAGFANITYSPTDAITGQDDLVYILNSSGGQAGQIKTYRYTAGVLATRGSALPAFTLYPNPATDEVTLKLPTAAVAGQRVALLNVCGQLVREQVLPAGSTSATLSLATLKAGVYFVQSGSTIQKLLRQ
jgi:hypothetical protein